MKLLIAFLVLVALLVDQRKQGNPLDNLPATIEVLTHFGERADISPDNQRVAFMSKSFGDAMVIDVKTRIIQCLTSNVPGAAFLRVMHLVTGDYILIGPDHFENIHVSRTRDNELWFLSKERGSKPVKLVHHKTVFASKDRSCVLEAQDFYDNDTRMTFTCYEPNDQASVMGIDLESGEVTNFSKAPGTYNEPEGIFPDGIYTTVEADRQSETLGGRRGSGNIDIWKMKLDGTGKDFVRLTHFNDYVGGKASNPVVSTDGRFMAFQAARTTDPAGVGYGILIFWFGPSSLSRGESARVSCSVCLFSDCNNPPKTNAYALG